MKVEFIGLGRMGQGMAGRLLLCQLNCETLR